MDKINNAFSHNPKYLRLQKPLQAAEIVTSADLVGNGRFKAISFKDGLLTVGVPNSMRAANIKMETLELIKEINQKIGKDLVKEIRTRII